MAHFARVNRNNVVVKVHSIDNSIITDSNGNESEELGKQYLQKLHRTTDDFVQTSYNNSLRKNYAGKGFTFDRDRNGFIPPKPYESFVLNEESLQWENPIPLPEDASSEIQYSWDEQNLQWVLQS